VTLITGEAHFLRQHFIRLTPAHNAIAPNGIEGCMRGLARFVRLAIRQRVIAPCPKAAAIQPWTKAGVSPHRI
jgi:hypothetical protein